MELTIQRPKKLNIEEKKKIIELANITDDEKLKKKNILIKQYKVRNIEAKALRILRHPFSSRELKDYRDIAYKH